MSTDLSIFSNETLDSITMAEVIGGDGADNCHGGNCVSGCGCDNSGVCGNIDVNAASICIKQSIKQLQ